MGVPTVPHPNPPDPVIAIERVLCQLTGSSGPTIAEEMQGGASTRRFFRVRLNEATAIAMHVPGASQEIAKIADGGRRWPFLEVRDLLAERGVRVPDILHEACPEGVLLVEDLGDYTLASFLEEFPNCREELYQMAVRDLAHAQRSLSTLPHGSIVTQRAFDHDLLLWEVEHFREWGLEARGIYLNEEDLAVFERAAHYLARTVSSWPRGFVHRDYQSRNLMVRRDLQGLSLTWIDFQDALLGPRVYDLVALLTDSYQEFSRDFIEARLDEYALHLGLNDNERLSVAEEFDTTTVQRKLKDAGRFIFIDRVNKNPNFLKFVEPTIAKARAAMARLTHHPELAELDALLERVLS